MNNTIVPNGKHELTDEAIISHAVDTLAGDKDLWVLWQYEDDDKGRSTKMPYTRYNRRASSADPGTWLPYQEVKDAYEEHDCYDGIGIMFDGSFLGVDIDNCLEDGIIVDPIIQAFVDASDTYTEISPSGNGLHLYFKLTDELRLSKCRTGKVFEAYTEKRYFTFTGNLFNQNLVREVTPEQAESLLMIMGYKKNPVAEAVEQVVSGSSANLELETVKQKMFNSQNGTELEALYNGDTSKYGDDTSVADAALVKNLAYWTDNNRQAMETLWLQSELGKRDKNQQRADYVARTLDYALSNSSGTTTATTLEVTSTNSSSTATQETRLTLRQRFAAAEVDLEDLLKMDIKVDWDVEQLITKGSLNMIASPPHQGKTFMALHIAVCIAFSRPVFGKFKVPENKNVMIINEEDILVELKGRLEEMVPDERTRDRIKLYASTGDKVSQEWADAVLERAKINNTGLIILDSFGALSLANENDAQSVYEVMDHFRRFIREGITVIFIHHDRKGSTQGGDAGSKMDRARGSGAIGAVVHGYLSIQELSNDQFVVSQVKLKANVRKAKPFVVQRNRTLGSDASFRHEFEYVGEYNPDATAVEGIEERLVRLCQKQGSEFLFTRKTMVDHKLTASADDKTLRNSLKWMMQKGLLQSGTYGDLDEDRKLLVVTEVQKANTLVYWATDALLSQKKEEGVDDSGVPF
jgi:hypothetical protein